MTVQKHIIEGISELLYTHDYVVVPGFGGFVSRAQHAHYSLNKGILNPPSKKILFNVQLKQNDGILSTWLKDKLNCDFNSANAHLDEFAQYCKMLLTAKRRLEFENLGLFYLDFENNICFEPKTDINFLIESFGLSAVTLKELEPEELKTEKQIIETVDRFAVEERSNATPVIPKKRNYRRIAALAVGIPFIGAAILFAASQMKPNSFLQSALMGSSVTTNYTPVNYNSTISELDAVVSEPYVVDANGYAAVNFFGNDKTIAVNISAVATEKHTKKKATQSRIDLKGKYQVVMGCFGVTSNAKRLINKLAKENVKAGISGTNAKGLHVVSCGGFETKEDAVALLQNLKSRFPNAWIMAQE